MSTHLHWIPDKPRKSNGIWSVALKQAVRRRYAAYGEADAAILDRDDIGWLLWIKDTSPEDSDSFSGAQTLIEAIGKYGSIRLWEDE